MTRGIGGTLGEYSPTERLADDQVNSPNGGSHVRCQFLEPPKFRACRQRPRLCEGPACDVACAGYLAQQHSKRTGFITGEDNHHVSGPISRAMLVHCRASIGDLGIDRNPTLSALGVVHSRAAESGLFSIARRTRQRTSPGINAVPPGAAWALCQPSTGSAP